MNDVVLSPANLREALAEAQRLYAEAKAYIESRYEGYCFHGKYVGGCGIDWMCGWCESGDEGSSPYDYLEGIFRYSLALATVKGRLRKEAVISWCDERLSQGMGVFEILDVAETQLSRGEHALATHYLMGVRRSQREATR